RTVSRAVVPDWASRYDQLATTALAISCGRGSRNALSCQSQMTRYHRRRITAAPTAGATIALAVRATTRAVGAGRAGTRVAAPPTAIVDRWQVEQANSRETERPRLAACPEGGADSVAIGARRAQSIGMIGAEEQVIGLHELQQRPDRGGRVD